MSKDKAPASGGSGDGHLLWPLLILLLLLFASKVLGPWFIGAQSFWILHHHKIVLCLGALAFTTVGLGIATLRNRWIDWHSQAAVLEKDESSIFLGHDSETKRPIHLKEDFRTAHTQVIGSTNAGKTASVILPWALQDIEKGRGLLIIDGKADRGFLNKIYSYTVKHTRQKDFHLFSLAQPSISSTYNPFCEGTPEQIAERVFSTLELTDPYYGSLQFSALRTVVALLIRRGEKPMPGVVRELLRNKEALEGWLIDLEDKNLIRDVMALLQDRDDEFQKKYSGLVTALGHFSQGITSPLYNTRNPEIDLMEVILRKKICYFQLPTMQFPFLGAATGKLVLQSLQSAVSEIQVGSRVPDSLFSVYLDDFNDYIYPGFASVLNKSRSANVGVVFSHQSLGDLEKVSPDFKQIVLTNTNIKVIMRSNDPDSAEFFAKMIGTQSREKTTERRTRTLFGSQDTGDQSVREAEEYLFHPNLFKSELGRGEGVMVIPHPNGTEVKKIKLTTFPDLASLSLPVRDLPTLDLAWESTYRGLSTVPMKSTPKERGSKS